jgi:hypothetical protein
MREVVKKRWGKGEAREVGRAAAPLLDWDDSWIGQHVSNVQR